MRLDVLGYLKRYFTFFRLKPFVPPLRQAEFDEILDVKVYLSLRPPAR